jgi:Myb-like DNA-binding domain
VLFLDSISHASAFCFTYSVCSAKECHERWIRYLKPGVRKGQWTDHEDAIVMEVVTSSTEQPFTRWSDLAQRLPGRVGKQIRDRWVNHLNPHINHLPFSREDDLALWEGHKKLGKRWVEIATKYFDSSRSENHIKNRWYSASFKKFISNEFGLEAYTGKTKSGGGGGGGRDHHKDSSSSTGSISPKKKGKGGGGGGSGHGGATSPHKNSNPSSSSSSQQRVPPPDAEDFDHLEEV